MAIQLYLFKNILDYPLKIYWTVLLVVALPLIPVSRQLRQVCDFETSLSCIVKPCLREQKSKKKKKQCQQQYSTWNTEHYSRFEIIVIKNQVAVNFQTPPEIKIEEDK